MLLFGLWRAFLLWCGTKTCMADGKKTTGEKFERAVEILARLRGPGGCPWDREQTFDSIKPFTLEETYEVLEAIDNRDWDELTGELGDLLLQVLFYSEMAQEEKHFSIDDVLDRLSNKLVGRHPHVFGDVKAETSSEVLRNWEMLKAEEKRKRLEAGGGKYEKATGDPNSVLANVSSGVPALLEATKLSARAAHVGFDWPTLRGIFEKMQEETRELEEHLHTLPGVLDRPKGKHGVAGSRGNEALYPEQLKNIEGEIGDLMFTLVNLARYLAVDPESALKKTNRKFRRRFQYVESKLKERGGKIETASLDEMESLWQEAKTAE
jgi:nucleoside triphosphate diphosphatase